VLEIAAQLHHRTPKVKTNQFLEEFCIEFRFFAALFAALFPARSAFCASATLATLNHFALTFEGQHSNGFAAQFLQLRGTKLQFAFNRMIILAGIMMMNP
jgi:hypothetical protein